MKNNVFQNILVVMFAVAALVATGSVSAYKCQASDFVGSCGIFDEDDVRIGMEMSAAAKPDPQAINQKFVQVMMKPWERVFKCYVFESWAFFNDKQKQKVIDRMYEQGLISSEQAENWQNSPYPPCVETDRDRIGG